MLHRLCSPTRPLRALLPLLAAFAPLAGADPAIVSLKDFVATEVRHQGFTLAKDARIHVYARGAGGPAGRSWRGEAQLHAYGWILNAATREVVWQMGPGDARKDGDYRIADTWLDLPKGSYEAYFSDHGFAHHTFFSHWNRNIDRRHLSDGPREQGKGFGFVIGVNRDSVIKAWREEAANVGMEIHAAAGEIQTFQAPLRWKNVVVSLDAKDDNTHQVQAFRTRKPVRLHIYAEGEGDGNDGMVDHGWITDTRTRRRVWEMVPDKATYAGGASKNRRTVETIDLPAGDYEATFVTDDSHSPADWNAAPPCDPGFYGLTLALPRDEDKAAFTLLDARTPGKPLAALVSVRSDQDLSVDFKLAAPETVRVYALGEWDDDWADCGWIENAATREKVWTMKHGAARHAGGARKNLAVDEMVSLPKGSYTLRYRTDDSHAHGNWNADAPRDAEHYGITVYASPR